MCLSRRQICNQFKLAEELVVFCNTILQLKHPVESVTNDACLNVDHVAALHAFLRRKGPINIAKLHCEFFLGESEEVLIVPFTSPNDKMKVCSKCDINDLEKFDICLFTITQLVGEAYLVTMFNCSLHSSATLFLRVQDSL